MIPDTEFLTQWNDVTEFWQLHADSLATVATMSLLLARLIVQVAASKGGIVYYGSVFPCAYGGPSCDREETWLAHSIPQDIARLIHYYRVNILLGHWVHLGVYCTHWGILAHAVVSIQSLIRWLACLSDTKHLLQTAGTMMVKGATAMPVFAMNESTVRDDWLPISDPPNQVSQYSKCRNLSSTLGIKIHAAVLKRDPIFLCTVIGNMFSPAAHGDHS